VQQDKPKRFIFLTGPPRTGKTTILLKAAEKLKARGFKLGGMTSQEIREKGVRVGFEIRDYASGRSGWLAHIHQPSGPQIGKYHVNLSDLKTVGVTAILTALESADIVLIDEIGPMELCSETFKDAIERAVGSSKLVLATIHYSVQHPLIIKIKSREDVEIIEVTQESRVMLPALIADRFTLFKKASEKLQE
jgi:nucleoside-triphosphatase